MYALEVGWIPVIILLPLLGALLNGLFGARLGKDFVRWVGVGAPAVAFVLSLAAFFGLYFADYGNPLDDRGVVALIGNPGAVAGAERELASDPRAKNWVITTEKKGTVLRVRNIDVDDDFLRIVKERQGLDGGAASAAPRSYVADLGRWISVGSVDLRFAFRVDRLAVILMLVITGVGTLIHLYSTGYMGHEPASTFARYFTYLNLFVGAMLVLVMGSNILLMFIGWEGVGLCSYLLIGFEYDDPAKAACGTKAFVVNRIGDVGFVLGTLTLLVGASHLTGPITLDFEQLNGLAHSMPADLLSSFEGGERASSTLPIASLGLACLLLFIGATGKSAQIPLHLWLPDAMAGPTPVSALIHAATMVTAGVYMVARMAPIFAEATVGGVPVLGIVAVVGVLTAFFAGLAALGQDDIKKVLAYSTISQLGYMFVGVGALAMGAAVFHLVTHAFFKALLFLGAGAVIHATHTQSMRRMGGLRKSMPTTFWTMTVGALALAGFPLLSGFFSKDMILFETLVRFKSTGGSSMWAVIYVLGVVTGLITAVYSTRLICMTFFGEYRGSGTPHEAPPAMAAPLVVLGLLAIVGGLLGLPELLGSVGLALPNYLGAVWEGVVDKVGKPSHDDIVKLEIGGLLVGTVAALVGVALGWMGWNRHPDEVPWEQAAEPQASGGLTSVRRVLANAWFYDELINKKFVQPVTKYLSTMLWKHVDDTAIDRGLVDGSGRVAEQLSLFVRVFQNGRVSRYAAYLVLGTVLVLAAAILTPLFGH